MAVNEAGWPISRLVVGQLEGGQWHTVLSASKDWIRNDAGYVGIEFIDDSYSFSGYWAAVAQRDDGERGILISLTYMLPNGDPEGAPLQIGWNYGVGRYQEIVNNDSPYQFGAEIRQPPHRHKR